MSVHDDMWAGTGLPTLMNHFGDAGRVTYTARGGVAITPVAIVGDETADEEPYRGGRRRVVRRTLSITTDPDGTFGGVAIPTVTATVTVDGVPYAVEKINSSGRDCVDLVVVRFELLEVSRPDYREPNR